MIKISETLSKEVISLSNAQTIGIVVNAYLKEDLSALRGWLVVQDDSDEEKMLPLSYILGATDALTVMNDAALKLPRGIKCPLGRKVYDSEGRFLGTLRDVTIDKESGHTEALWIDEQAYDRSLLLRATEHGVILRAPTHSVLRIRRAPAKATSSKRSSAPSSHLLPSPVEHEEKAERENMTNLEQKAQTEDSAAILYGEYSFLIGRIVNKDLIADGEVFAKEGTTVNASIIENARCKGKLVELTVNSTKA